MGCFVKVTVGPTVLTCCAGYLSYRHTRNEIKCCNTLQFVTTRHWQTAHSTQLLTGVYVLAYYVTVS